MYPHRDEYARRLFGLGGDYLEAAEALSRIRPGRFPPSYSLVCSAIELSLKSFLARSGFSERELRKVGRNLTNCLCTAEAEGLHASLTRAHWQDVTTLSEYHSRQIGELPCSSEEEFTTMSDALSLARHLRIPILHCVAATDFRPEYATLYRAAAGSG